MLDRKVVKEFLEEELQESKIKLPHYISKKTIVESFCKYTEDDYYEWLMDNFKSFLTTGVQIGIGLRIE